jgi:hypothetical protein
VSKTENIEASMKRRRIVRATKHNNSGAIAYENMNNDIEHRGRARQPATAINGVAAAHLIRR